MTLPSAVVLGATFGSGANNSDTDRITALWRTNTSTPIIDAILYDPYGSVKQYNQLNKVANKALRTRITRNLAYRQTLNVVEKVSGGSPTQSSVTLAEDAKGRITTRDYFPSNPAIAGRHDSWFQYDLQDRVLCEATASGSCPTSGSTLKNNHSATPPFMAAGDWKQLKRPIPGSTGVTHGISIFSLTHQISTVSQSDGTPVLGNTDVRYDSRGNRNFDDNLSGLTHDLRTYSYDDRRNVVNVRGEYFTGGTWRFYNVASAFDARNRRVFKSFYDETTLKTATWFFYYDPLDRLAEIRHTSDTSASTTYSLFQLSWLGDKLVHYWQTDYPSVTTSKRYVSTDEANRPVDMMSWPTSGDATRVWTINPDAWGNDSVLVGGSVFQPILFAGQYKDDETIAWQNDGVTRHRPGIVLNGFRTYDPWTGSYLQVDPMVDSTWSSYVYADSNPIGNSDPDGRARIQVNINFGIGQNTLIFGNCWDHNYTEDLTTFFSAGNDPWGDGWGWGWGGGGAFQEPCPQNSCSKRCCPNNNINPFYSETGCKSCSAECERLFCPNGLEDDECDRVGYSNCVKCSCKDGGTGVCQICLEPNCLPDTSDCDRYPGESSTGSEITKGMR